ncbi:nucleoside/nucleotide kinase family protein [Motilibacter aurantiacus]|uniref:nucleoside/nucleotide kinase family protein n=1 Tax=Motilibacter aurantiacus TaxID=2714955 RepID=UPI00140B4127|nr:nucleoside/nucleotide kinase family protein [Motilibacter aurantiacus]NHC44169.1 nucleoside/nucleotide kinase family protein [Motilibacter aurantiacus]
MDLSDLVERARSLVTPDGPRAVLGITGSPGAGKSTLAEELLAALRDVPPAGLPAGEWVAHLPMDGYHLADVELDRLGRRGRKGAPDTFDAHGYAALLERALQETGETVYAPAFERTIEQPIAGSIPVLPAARLVITEGNYLLHEGRAWRRARAAIAEVWYVDLDEDVRLARLVARHERFGKAPDAARAWVQDVDQRNAELIAATRDRADLVVPSALVESLGAPPAA